MWHIFHYHLLFSAHFDHHDHIIQKQPKTLENLISHSSVSRQMYFKRFDQ